MAINWMCFTTSLVFLIHFSTPEYLLSTFLLYQDFNFQLSVRHWAWKFKCLWMWTTVNQRKAVVLSWNYQCLLLFPLYSLSSVTPIPTAFVIPIVLQFLDLLVLHSDDKAEKTNYWKKMGTQPFNFLFMNSWMMKKKQGNYIPKIKQWTVIYCFSLSWNIVRLRLIFKECVQHLLKLKRSDFPSHKFLSFWQDFL